MIVFGLGNPEEKYSHTRHNAGFDALERTSAFFQVQLKKRCFCKYRYATLADKTTLVEPLTYMNNSGKVVKFFKKRILRKETFVVIMDNMDLPVGSVRIRMGGGTSGQKGLNSIIDNLGSGDFIRIYVGIGRPDPGVSVADHVLSKEKDPVKAEEYNKALDTVVNAIRMLKENRKFEEVQCDCSRKGLL